MTKPKERPDPPNIADERAQLTGFLDFHRATVVWKSEGLTDEQARRSLLPSELITVGGLVSHLRLNEEWWFENVIGDKPDAWKEILDEDPDAEFRLGKTTPLSQLIAGYKAQCEISRELVAKRDLDDVVSTPGGKEFSVRWVILHMIEETARHVGHLDLIREQLDGLTGE
jgi:hypothetical protein